jgi:hypothetical protein
MGRKIRRKFVVSFDDYLFVEFTLRATKISSDTSVKNLSASGPGNSSQ